MRTEAVRSNMAPSRPITVRDPVFSTWDVTQREQRMTGKRERTRHLDLLSAGAGAPEAHG